MKLMLLDEDREYLGFLAKTIDWKSLGISDLILMGDIEAAKEVVINKQPGIVLASIQCIDGDHKTIISWIRERYETIVCAYLIKETGYHYANEAISSGVFDYLIKGTEGHELGELIKKIVCSLLEMP